MVLGMIPAFTLPAKAATNLAGGFEGQDADVFSALGFDTSEIPEGYDADTTDNPYGRDIIPGNQVFEVALTSSTGLNVYGQDNNDFSYSDINSMPTGTTMPGGMQLFASAAGDFDGDGLPGGVAYVGVSGRSGAQDLYLYFYDGEDYEYGSPVKIGSITPASTLPDSAGVQQEYQEHFDFAWQNLLQISAGDYDGDGISEVAVYVAEKNQARVDIYKYQKTSQSGEKDWVEASKWARIWSYALSSSVAPNMVALQSGDFNRDGVDDLAISSGSLVFNAMETWPSGGEDSEGNSISGRPYTFYEIATYLWGYQPYTQASTANIMWGAKSDALQKSESLDLNTGELGELARVSFAYGDINGDGVDELITAGQPMADAVPSWDGTFNTARTITTYTYADGAGLSITSSGTYKVIDGEWITIDDGSGSSTTQWQTGNTFDDEYYSMPMMRANAAVMTPAGNDYTYIYVDSCLYKYMEGQLQLAYALDEDSDGDNGYSAEDKSLALPKRWGLNGEWPTNGIENRYYCEYGAVSGDVTGNGEILTTSFTALSDYNTYNSYAGYQDEIESKDGKYGYADEFIENVRQDKGVFVLWGTQNNQLSNSLVSCVDEDQDGVAVSAALVDVDMDTIIIEYTGVHYLTYSDPKVLAIIAAAPYFEDVDEVVDYDYAWQNTTSYSRIVGSGESDIVTLDLEIGGWWDNDVTALGGKVVVETAVMYTMEWEKEISKSTEYELTFETSQDEDAVAFYSIPTENYVYNIYTPDGEGGYDVTTNVISNTFTPCYQILNLDYYESIQGNYDELPQISGVALTSTPGDPGSYPSSTSGYNVIAEWNDDPAGVSFGNGSISQTITITEEQSESYNMGAAWDFKIGGGAGIQNDLGQTLVEISAGAQWSLNPADGWATMNLTGTSFSGTVTNMPLEFQDYGYYYTWKIFAYNYVFEDGTSIPVVSYVVGDVSEPPELPDDFQQDFARTTSEENVLTWTYDGEATNFYIYKYYDFPEGGGLELVEAISPSDSTHFQYKYDENGELYKEYYFVDENLTPYTEYQYAIQVERINRVPPLSSPSALLTARTKAANGYPTLNIIESDGKDDGNLLVYPDKNGTLTVDVKGPGGESSGNYYSIVQYQWQKMENGFWTDMVNETGQTLIFANAGVDTAGSYRCRVNVQTKADATYITAYTGSVELTHSKRTAYFDNLSVTDVTGGGIQLYAEVKNAHGESASIPTGIVTFTLTNTATGVSYPYLANLDAAGTAAKVLEGTLPAGLYTVEAYYSGSYIFKSCSGESTYLSNLSTGYTIDLPDTIIYGNEAAVTFYEIGKSGGVTTSKDEKPASVTLTALDYTSTVNNGARLQWNAGVYTSEGLKVGSIVAGTNYKYPALEPSDRSVWMYFAATHSGTARLYDDRVVYFDAASYLKYSNDGGKYTLAANTPAGNYLLTMTSESGETVEVYFNVATRPLTLQLPTMKGAEGTPPADITYGDLTVASGSWADCDNPNGELNATIAEKTVNVTYYNAAGTAFTKDTVAELCGAYAIRSTDRLDNYALSFYDGSIAILGATHEVKIGVRPFEGQQVGTLYAVTPDYAYTRSDISDAGVLTQEQQTGTRLVFSAVPDAGYEIYEWYINGEPLGTTESSISHVMLNEETTVEVQFAVTANSLSFGTAGDVGGGTIVCDDPDITSGSVVLANSLFNFTATANQGYHFKEWRYTELGQGTVYDNKDEGRMESTFELVMPTTSCSVYAVFERDYYTFSFEDLNGNDGLVAWYENRVNDAPDAATEKVYIESGDLVKGDTRITIEVAEGCSWDSRYNFVSTGSQGTADYTKGTYVVTVKQDTRVTGYTNRELYDVELSFDVTNTYAAPQGAEIVYTINGQEYRFPYDEDAASMTIPDIPGGTSFTAQIVYPAYYDLTGWVSDGTKLTATTDVNRLATEVADGGAVSKDQPYYYSYTPSGGAATVYYFIATATGTVRFTGSDVTIYAASPIYSISKVNSDEEIAVYLTEKATHTVTLEDISGKGTYSYDLPDGAGESENADGKTVVTLHDRESLTIMVTPAQKWTVTYWKTTPEGEDPVTTRATSLRYTIPNITGNYTFEPIFSSTTYNTISWPTISESTVRLTLLPESGYLTSVSAGGDFKFTLSGGSLNLVDKVYANGNEFTTAGNEVDGTTYSYDVDTGVYTISNVTANQVITVTFKEIGVTVNGEDISAFTGSGWSYDAAAQMLTLNASNLTVSGTNDETLAPELRIVASETVSSLSLSGLTLNSNTGKEMIVLESTNVTLTVSGSNTLYSKRNDAISGQQWGTGIEAEADLTIRGDGTISLKDEGRQRYWSGITAWNSLSIQGNLTLLVDSSDTAISVYGSDSALTIGTVGSTASPTIRVTRQSISCWNDLVLNAGELSIYASDTPLTVHGSAEVYGGIMELHTDVSVDTWYKNIFDVDDKVTVYYPNGYTLRYLEKDSADGVYGTFTKAAGDYSTQNVSDVLVEQLRDGEGIPTGYQWTDGLPGNGEYVYFRLSPSTGGGGTASNIKADYSVTSGGSTYTGTITFDSGTNTDLYWYVDHKDNNKLKYVTVSTIDTTFTNSGWESQPNITIVAKQGVESTGYGTNNVEVELGVRSVSWTHGTDDTYWTAEISEASGATADYTLSGAIDSGATRITATNSTIQSLTLAGLTANHLTVSDIPVYLSGSNYLTGTNVPAAEHDRPKYTLNAEENTLNLYGEENASLTLTTYSIPAIAGTTVNLYDGADLTLFYGKSDGNISLLMNGIEVNYVDTDGAVYDSVTLPYGVGWRQDYRVGTGNVQTAAELDPDVLASYIRFYPLSTSASAGPASLTYDVDEGSGDLTVEIVSPAVNGQVHPYSWKEQKDAGYIYYTVENGEIVLIDETGTEKTLTTDQHSVSFTNYATGTITFGEAWLKSLEAGSYTIRVNFYDDDTSDNTYYNLDIPLTITKSSVSTGGLTVSPVATNLGRGKSITLATQFTGTTPQVYKWEISGAGTLSENGGSSAVLKVNEGAAIGSTITVTVSSFADKDNTWVGDALGTATATITVTSTAQSIDITADGETPSGDGSYTLYHNTPDGSAKTWIFRAEVSTDDNRVTPSRITWSLWGNQRQATKLTSNTQNPGLTGGSIKLTIDPNETGTNGQLQLTATYTNDDGSTISKTVIIHLSTDAWVNYDNSGAENGEITGAVWGNNVSIASAGDYVPAGSTVVVTAEPEEEFLVNNWYVNGRNVMDDPNYTVDGENNTLTFTVTSMSHYVVTADYVNENGFVITYSAGENGSLTAQSGGKTLPSGSMVVKGSSVTFTATPDTHCTVAKWIVDGTDYTDADGNIFTGNSLTLDSIDADHSVTVEFVGAEIEISFAADAGGSVTLLVNGQKIENAASPCTVHAMDDVLILASPESSDYLVDQWLADDGSGSYTPISGSEGMTTYAVENITEGFDVKVSFKAVPSYEITVTTNSYQNGYGVVKSGTTEVPMSGSRTFTVKEHDTLTLLAVPDTGSYVYKWSVPEGVEYVENGNSITLLDVKGNLNDIDAGQYIGVTFRRNFYDVTLATEGSGTLEASYSLTIGSDQFNGTISGSESIRGGSRVDFTVTPGQDYILSAITVNGTQVTPTWNETDRNYTYTIDALTESVEVKAVFTQTAELLTVTVPASFTHENEADPSVTVAEGAGMAGYVPDGISKDVPDADLEPGTDAVQMANGGTARLTFTPEDGYTVNYNILADEMNTVLAAAGSNAVYSLSMSGNACVVTITGVDANLDFTTMTSPFVAETVTTYHTVTIGAVTNGTLEVYWNSVQLLSGAMVPAGSELTIVATPEEHFDVEKLTVGGVELTATTFTVTDDVTLDAEFARSEYEVTIDILGSGSGTVTINGADYTAGTYTMAVDSVLAIAAKAADGSAVNTIGVPGGSDDGSGTYTVTLNSDLTVTAVFDAQKCVVTFNDPANGTLTILDSDGDPVTNGQLVPVGTTLTIMVIPDAHYELGSLTAGGADYMNALSSYVSYTVNAEKSNHIQCVFAVAEVPVSWNSTGGTISVTLADGTAVSNGQYVPVGTTLIVKAVPNTDYSLETFTVTGTTVGSDGTCTVGTEPVVITAEFEYSGEIPTGPEGPQGPAGPAGPGGVSPSGEYTVELHVSGNGKLHVTANGKEIASGDVVKAGTVLTITAEPAEGELLTTLTVNGVTFTSGGTYEVYANTIVAAQFGENSGLPYYLDSNGNKVFIGFAYDADGDGTWDEGEYIAPEGVEVLFTENHKTLDDVPGHWGEEYIDFVADREILVGITDSLFAPNNSVTRAMFATVLGRLYERSFGIQIQDGEHDFDDCNYNAYYGKYVDWAAENGIINGYGHRTFGPEDLITREQMATMLYRFAVMMGVVPQEMDTELTFADSGDVAAWAKTGILYCQSEGLISGIGNNIFAPQNTATRAQMATIIHNFIKVVVG